MILKISAVCMLFSLKEINIALLITGKNTNIIFKLETKIAL